MEYMQRLSREYEARHQELLRELQRFKACNVNKTGSQDLYSSSDIESTGPVPRTTM